MHHGPQRGVGDSRPAIEKHELMHERRTIEKRESDITMVGLYFRPDTVGSVVEKKKCRHDAYHDQPLPQLAEGLAIFHAQQDQLWPLEANSQDPQLARKGQNNSKPKAQHLSQRAYWKVGLSSGVDLFG